MHDKRKVNNCYSKSDVCANYKAMIESQLNNESFRKVRKHDTNHNHELCHENQRHFTHSQRAETKNHIGYLQKLKNSGVFIATALRVMDLKYKSMNYYI